MKLLIFALKLSWFFSLLLTYIHFLHHFSRQSGFISFSEPAVVSAPHVGTMKGEDNDAKSFSERKEGVNRDGEGYSAVSRKMKLKEYEAS